MANRASGGRTDPAPFAAALEAEIFGLDALDEVRDYAPERIAVAGGDGSIGTVAALAGELDVPLAVIPTGTANDFARANAHPARPRGGR